MRLKKKTLETFKIKEAAQFLGVSQDTLRRWEKVNKISPLRTGGGTRLYTKQELQRAKESLSQTTLSISEAAEKLGVSTKTLRRWDLAGKLTPERSQGGVRVYRLSEIEKLLEASNPKPESDKLNSKLDFQKTQTIQLEPASLASDSHLDFYIKPFSLDYVKTPDQTASEPTPTSQADPPPLIHDRSRSEARQASDLPQIRESGFLRYLRISTLAKTAVISASTLTLLITAIITNSYLAHPQATKKFFSTKSPSSQVLTPFNTLSQLALSLITPQLSKQINAINLAEKVPEDTSKVLAAVSKHIGNLTFNTDSTINGNLQVLGNLSAPNILIGLTAGTNVYIDNTNVNQPAISVTLPTNLVKTVGKKSGDITLGTGLAISDGNALSVNAKLSDIRANGGCDGCLTDGDIADNITISSSGSVDPGALSGTVTVGKGGTGLSSFNTGDLIYASAANTLKNLAIGTTNQALIVSAGIPSWTAIVNSLTGTTNQVNVSASTGSVTLSLPQAIATTSSPSFTGLTVSGLTTDGVVKTASGVLSSEAQLATTRGGLGASVTAAGAGELLYSTGTTTYGHLAAGTSTYVLTSGGAGAPVWVNQSTLTSSPSFTNITSGTNVQATMTVSTGASLNYSASGTINASSLEGNTWEAPGTIGSTTPNSGVFTTLSATPGSNTTALTLTGTNVTSSNLTYLNAKNSSGTILNLAYGSTQTLTGALTGESIDLNNGQVTTANNSVTGLVVTLPTVTDSNAAGTVNIKGFSFGFGTGSGINQTGAGSTVYSGVDVSLPALTQTSGTLTGNGVNITTSSQITTGGTANGVNISSSGVGAGSLNGVNISGITGGAGTETALNIGSGWDKVLAVGGTTIINGSGVTQVAGGGTGLSTYNTGDLIYASSTNTLSSLAGGTPNNGKVLTVSSGLPVWGTIAGSSCTDCVVNDPTAAATNTITPSTNIQSLIVRQTTAVTPTADIFDVTNKDGTTKYFYVDSSGNVSTGGVASQTLTLTPASDTTALTLVGTNVATQALQYINSKNASAANGIVNLAYGVAQTLTGAVTGIREDLSTNVTATNQNVTGASITLPSPTNTGTSGTNTLKGLTILAGGGINQNGAGGTTTFSGVDVSVPALTQSAGTINGYGVNITTPSSITTGGTAAGVNINASGVAVGTLYGMNIGAITAGAGSQTAVNIGTGWNNVLTVGGTAIINGSGVTQIAGGGTGTSTSFTQGSVVFAGASGVYSQNNSQFFWDNTNNRLGIGTTSPSVKLQVQSGDVYIAGGGLGVNVAAGTNQAIITNRTLTGSVDAYGLFSSTSGASDVTNSLQGVYSKVTSAASITLSNAYSLHAIGPTVGSGGAITNAYGLYIDSQKPTGVTNAYGIYQSGSTDNNYFSGNVGIGTTSPDAKLQIVQSGASSIGLHLQQSGSVINNNDNAAFYVQDQQTNGTAFRVRNDSATTASYFSHIYVNNASANTVALRLENLGLGDTFQIVPPDPKVNNDGGNLKSAKIINVASTDHSYLTLDNRDLTVGGHKNQITISNVNKVFVYDTTKDADGGRWTNDERAQGSSWYNESRTAADACVIGTNTRCGTQAFPKKAILVATNTHLYIFDAKDNSLWMDFQQGSNFYLVSNLAGNSVTETTTFGLNGVIYVGDKDSTNTYGDVYMVNFKLDQEKRIANSATIGTNQYQINTSAISSRNSSGAISTLTLSGYNLVAGPVTDVTAQVINGKTYIAAATIGTTNGDISLIDETDLTVANFGVASKAYQSIKLSLDNTLYGLNSTDSELDVWYSASTKYGNNVATSVTYTSSSTPALWSSAPTINSSAPDQLFVTQGTSTSDGKSNTIYVAHNAGLSVVQENQGTQASGTVKYYTTNSISEEMVGDIRGMWPFAGSSALSVNTTLPAADNDVSLKASNLTTTANVPTHVSGVRGNGLSFNGTNSLVCSGTAGTCSTNANLGITGDMTYGTWFKSGTTAQATPIVWKPNGYALLYSNYSTIGTLNKYTCAWYDSVGATWRTVASNQSTSTNWTQIACGISGTTMSIYINGLLDNTATYSGTRSAGTIFYLAGDNSASYFNGSLDEPYVSATVLTASEINHIYQVAYRALQNHASKTIRGTTIGADGSQVLGGFTNVTKAVAIDQEKGQIYVGTSAGNGAVSIIGIDSDTLNDLYSTSGTYSGMSITDEVAGSYSGGANSTYNNTLSISKGYGTGLILALGSNNAGSGGVWLESNDTTFKDFLATSYNPFGSNLTQSNVNVDSVFRVVNQLSSRIDNLALGSGSSGGTQPYLAEAFKIDSNGNLLSRSLFNSTTAMQFEDASGTTLLDLDTTNDRVGIGTTSPGGLLDLTSGNSPTSTSEYIKYYSSTYADRASNLILQKSDSNTVGTLTQTASGDMLGRVVFDGVNTSSAVADAAWIEADQDAAGGSTRIPGRLMFFTGTNAAAPTERMRIDNTGNVLIGTTTAGAGKLTVEGGSNVNGISLYVGNGFDYGQIYTDASKNLYLQASRSTSTNLYLGVVGSGQAITVLGNSGNVGIGTTTPNSKFQVNGGAAFADTSNFAGTWSFTVLKTASASNVAAITNLTTGDTGSDSTLHILLGTTSTGTSARFVQFYAGATNDNSGTGVGRIRLNNGGVAYESGGADFAEYFDIVQPVEPGDIISLTSSGKHKAALGEQLLGVVSDTASFVGNAKSETLGPNQAIVGLLGQIKTKVSTENGAISKGDLLTISSLAGVAMKATHPGEAIGKALEDYSGSGIGKILVFVKVGYADPNNLLANLTLDSDGTLIVPQLKVGKLTLDPAILTNLQVGQTQLASVITDVGQKLSDQDNQLVQLQAQTATNSAQLSNLSSQVAGVATQSAQLAVQISSTSAQLASDSSKIASHSAALADLKSKVDALNLTPPDILLATTSATLAKLTVTEDASISGKLAAYDISISNSLKSLGTTSLADTIIAGNLSVDGTLSLTGSSISTLSSTLYLQNNPLASLVDIFNGLVKIDNKGDLIAQTISSKKYAVDSSDSSSASLGSGTIAAGKSSVTIATSAINSSSKIFVTGRSVGTKALAVVNVKDGTSFDVAMDSPTSADLQFDWWIVDQH